MKEHILSRSSEYIPHCLSEKTHYDFASQINYLDEKFLNKLIHGHEGKGPTAVTETVEPSDQDNVVIALSHQLSLQGPTSMTYTVEKTDKDR